MICCTWLLLVNLGMIWCFGFFFLELLDDCDEESQQRGEALASLDDVGRTLGSVPTTWMPIRFWYAGLKCVVYYYCQLCKDEDPKGSDCDCDSDSDSDC